MSFFHQLHVQVQSLNLHASPKPVHCHSLKGTRQLSMLNIPYLESNKLVQVILTYKTTKGFNSWKL